MVAVPAVAAASRAAGAAGTATRARTAGAAGKAGKAKGAGKTIKSGQATRSGAATKGDVARLRRQAAAGDDLLQQAYQAGQDGTPFSEQIFAGTPGARDAWQSGADERTAGVRQARLESAGGAARKVANPGGPGWINDSAGWVLGLVVYALVLNYLQGGAAQARGWIGAKFLNRPYKP